MTILAQWSVKDYHLMIDCGILNNLPVELLEGEIIEMSPEGPLHRFINDTVAEYLQELLRGSAKVFEAHPITLSNSEPEPDIAVVRLPNTNYLTHHPYPEDIYWLIEISQTPQGEELGTKKSIYASAGINEYWVIDLITKEISIFKEPVNDDYNKKLMVTKGIIVPIAFPNLQIEAEKLLNLPS